jgi:hypothetical protein
MGCNLGVSTTINRRGLALIVAYMKEAEPPPPEVVPLQTFRTTFKNDSTCSRDSYKFHNGDIAWPKDGAGFY